MHTFLLRALSYLKHLLNEEQGQDLVEYALVVALVAFGAISGMRLLSTGLNHAFSNIATTLTSNAG